MKGECILYPGEAYSAAAQVPQDGPKPATGGLGQGEPSDDRIRARRSGRSCLAFLPDETLVGVALGDAAGAGVSLPDPVPPQDRDAAFSALVKRHYKGVRRVTRAVLRGSPDTEDAVQSAFLAAYRSLGSLKDRSKFKYWVRIIAVNEARDLLRDQPDIDGLDSLLTLPEAAQDRIPPQAAEAAWIIHELNDRLPDQYMKVLYLRYYLEFTVDEVAGMLGIQPGLVKWRANRARKLARQALSDSDAVPKVSSKKRKGGLDRE